MNPWTSPQFTESILGSSCVVDINILRRRQVYYFCFQKLCLFEGAYIVFQWLVHITTSRLLQCSILWYVTLKIPRMLWTHHKSWHPLYLQEFLHVWPTSLLNLPSSYAFSFLDHGHYFNLPYSSMEYVHFVFCKSCQLLPRPNPQCLELASVYSCPTC